MYGIECFNPLWKKDQMELLRELIKNDFEVIITGVAAYPLDEEWIGRVIDEQFIQDIEKLRERHSINPAGEGGEFETFVVNCPLFRRGLRIRRSKVHGSGNSWTMDVKT